MKSLFSGAGNFNEDVRGICEEISNNSKTSHSYDNGKMV